MDDAPPLKYSNATTIGGDYYYCDYRSTSRNVVPND